MNVFIILCDFFANNYFGTFSSLSRARTAFECFLITNDAVVTFKDNGNYGYTFYTKDGAYTADIYCDIVE